MGYRARRRKKDSLLWFKTQFVGCWRANVQRRSYITRTLYVREVRIRTTHKKKEKERKKRKSERANNLKPSVHDAARLASTIHCGGCQWPQGYEGCSSASLHISLGGARHKAGHDVTSNLHTLRVRSRVNAPPYRYTRPSCTHKIRRL